MKLSRSTEERIIGTRQEGAARATTEEICRRHGIGRDTFHGWRKEYGGMVTVFVALAIAIGTQTATVSSASAVLVRDRPTTDLGRLENVSQTRPQVLVVPESDGEPILLDGVFTEGEWEDAAEIDAGGGVKLLFKKEAGHVFIGVTCVGLQTPIADLFIQPTGQEIHQLHASAQVGERVVVEGEDLPFVWGHSLDWQANEVRWDQARRERLISHGMDEDEAQRQTVFPYQGFEFQIRRRKFAGTEWRLRVEVASYPDYDAPVVFPLDAHMGNTEGWLRLDLGSAEWQGREWGAPQAAPADAQQSQTPGLQEHLRVLEPLVDQTWVGHFVGRDDTASVPPLRLTWEGALNGNAVRLNKQSREVGLVTETLYYWDRERNELAFVGVSNTGYVSRGTVIVEGELIVHLGLQIGPATLTEYKQTFELLPDGTFEDRFYAWTPGGWWQRHLILHERTLGDSHRDVRP